MENFQVRVENLIGTKEKYEYDETVGKMHLDFVFKDGLLWPYNYGEILKTLGGDGDKLDAIVMSSQPLEVGQIIECRTVGMVELLDRGQEDNKILCVPTEDLEMIKIQDLSDIDKGFLKISEDFLMQVAKQKNKIMKVLSFQNRLKAQKEISKAKII